MEFNSQANAFVDTTRNDSYPATALTNFSVVRDYSVFSRLTFWNKLEFLKVTQNIELLSSVIDKDESKQLKALAQFRIYQLSKSA